VLVGDESWILASAQGKFFQLPFNGGSSRLTQSHRDLKSLFDWVYNTVNAVENVYLPLCLIRHIYTGVRC